MKSKKNVLMIYSDLGDGGIQRLLSLTSKELCKKYNLYLALFKDEKLYPFEGKIITLNAPTTSNPILTFQYLLKRISLINKIIKDQNIDIIISHSVIANAVALITKKFYRLEVPLIIAFHNSFIQMTGKMGIKGIIARQLNIRLKKYANKILNVSEGLSEELISLGFPSYKTVTIYNPVDIDEIMKLKKMPIEDHSEIFKSKIPVIISAGRLSKQKNFQMLLKAFSIIRKKIDIKLILLGDGNGKKSLVKLSKKLNCADDVIFTGWVKNPFKYIARSAIFVLPSLWEGFGNVLIEAMASGIPVVSTDCNFGPNEIIEHEKTGLLVPINNIEVMADSIYRILTDKNLASFLSHNAQKSITKFKLNKIGKQYSDLIDNTLNILKINKKLTAHPLISIVVINFNGKKYLEETIPAIFNLDYPNFEIIVIDNGSTDGSIEFLNQLKGIKVIKSERTGEKNYACNLGISMSKGEYILLMDNDLIIVEKGILSNLIFETNHLTRCGSISLAYINRGSVRTEGYGCYSSFYYSWEKPDISIEEVRQMHGKPVGSPNGAGIFIRKEIWNIAGGYDDHLAFGGDDDDLGMKLWLFGYSNYLYSNSLQIHIGMPERIDTFKYATKFQKKIYAHMYTIVKNFRPFNVLLVLNGYLVFSMAKVVKQAIKRKNIKPLTGSASGYFTFLKNIIPAFKMRKEVQKRRLIKKDIFFEIRPAFMQKHSRIITFMKIFK